MSRRDDTLRLQDMLAAARDACVFAVGKTEADLSHENGNPVSNFLDSRFCGNDNHWSLSV